MAGCPQEALNLLIALWKHRLLRVPHDFVTNCDGEYRDHERKIQVYSKDGVMMYDEKFF